MDNSPNIPQSLKIKRRTILEVEIDNIRIKRDELISELRSMEVRLAELDYLLMEPQQDKQP